MSRRAILRAVRTLILVVGAWCIDTSPVRAQTNTGTGSCGGSECHTKSGEIDWHNSKPGGKEHKASFGKMRAARENSEKYALAVKLDSFESAAGMCVRCHATYNAVGKTLEGVGCEGCHGPASGYRQFHSQNPKDYAGAVQKGMRNLQSRPAAWVRICKDCHVLDKPEYEPLIEAGHKDNARWNVVKKYAGVSEHWKKVTHAPAVIEAALKGVNPPRGADAAPDPKTADPKAADPKAADPKAADPKAADPKAADPKAADPKAPDPKAPDPKAPDPKAPDPKAPDRKAADRKATDRKALDPKAPDPKEPPPIPPVPTPPAPAAPASPMVPAVVVTSPLALTLPPAVTAVGLMAALQDRVAGLLESLLRKNAVPAVPLQPVDLTPQIAGPDADFLRLQSEALALAIEALNLRAKPGASPPK